jgi:hypothetical protein
LARAYLDQLERSNGLEAGKIAQVRAALVTAEKASVSERGAVLSRVVSQLEDETARAGDAAKVDMLASTVRELAGESRVASRR